MNSRKIKIFTLLLIALAMCPVASADNGSSTPIVFNYKPKTPIDGINRPHRVPGNIHLSLEVFTMRYLKGWCVRTFKVETMFI